jgi:hypothetical protein
MDDDDGNFPPVRRGTIGADTHIPLEPSPASASPRSTGPLDDLSRMSSLSHQPFIVTLVSSMCIRNFQDSAEENLCLHKAIVIKRLLISLLDHRFLAQKNYPSTPSQVCLCHNARAHSPIPKPSAQSPHRSYPPSSKDPGVPSSRQPNTDTSRLDRSRGSGHDPGHAYVDNFSRDDHMKGDPLYSSRGLYEEPPRAQGLAIRTSSHDDAPNRGPRINAAPVSPPPITPTRVIVENVRGRSRDRSPRAHREPRQMSTQSLSASLPAMQPGPPQDMQFVEDHRQGGRRIDRDREVRAPCVSFR